MARPTDAYITTSPAPRSAPTTPVDSGPARRGWTLGLASVGTFLATLDIVVVATALPTLQRELHAGLSRLEWTINAYNLVFACALLTGAALGDRFGHRRAYVGGLLLFCAGSAACATATSSDALIIARVVQGLGAAVVLPLTLTLITHAFPIEKRGAAIGIWGAVTGLGVAAGPVVGGAIVQYLSWHWIFWLNVPVGVAAAFLSLSRLPESHGSRPQLDLPGLVLAGVGMFGLTWAAVQAPSVGWGNAQVIAALGAGAVLSAAFFGWERRAAYPMLPLGLFRRRGFATANLVTFFQRISLLGSLFMITQLFQLGLGYSALQAGLRILVWMAMPMLVSPIAGLLSDKLGNRPLMIFGLALQGAGLGWLAAVTSPAVSYGAVVLPLIVSGIGISFVFPTVANAVVASVRLTDAGVAAGTNSAIGELATVFGIALVGAIFAHNGGYASAATFIHGFRPAMATVAIVPVLGIVAAIYAPSRRQTLAAAAALAESSD
jgi:EmrB/QacA subfamily drug resistance transporter